jgi:hypothetical protein
MTEGAIHRSTGPSSSAGLLIMAPPKRIKARRSLQPAQPRYWDSKSRCLLVHRTSPLSLSLSLSLHLQVRPLFIAGVGRRLLWPLCPSFFLPHFFVAPAVFAATRARAYCLHTIYSVLVDPPIIFSTQTQTPPPPHSRDLATPSLPQDLCGTVPGDRISRHRPLTASSSHTTTVARPSSLSTQGHLLSAEPPHPTHTTAHHHSNHDGVAKDCPRRWISR